MRQLLSDCRTRSSKGMVVVLERRGVERSLLLVLLLELPLSQYHSSSWTSTLVSISGFPLREVVWFCFAFTREVVELRFVSQGTLYGFHSSESFAFEVLIIAHGFEMADSGGEVNWYRLMPESITGQPDELICIGPSSSVAIEIALVVLAIGWMGSICRCVFTLYGRNFERWMRRSKTKKG